MGLLWWRRRKRRSPNELAATIERAFRNARDFDRGMGQISKAAGASTEEVQRLGRQLLSMSDTIERIGQVVMRRQLPRRPSIRIDFVLAEPHAQMYRARVSCDDGKTWGWQEVSRVELEDLRLEEEIGDVLADQANALAREEDPDA